MFTLRQLQHLLALADEQHFARAARRVNLSQPAFSRSVQAMERTAGMRLFERDTPVIQPTPGGAFLIERARQVVLDARSLQRDVTLYRDAQLGDTAIGLGPFPAASLAPLVLQRMRERHPQVGVRLEISNWALLVERLQREDIEFLVADTSSLQASARLEVQPLARQLVRFYVRSGHALQHRRCTLKDVWAHGVGAIKVPAAARQALAQRLDLPPDTDLPLALECDDVGLLHSLALHTDSAVATTDAALRQSGLIGQLHPVEVSDFPGAHAEMGLVWLKKRTLSPAAQALMQQFRTVADQLEAPAL